MDDNQTTTNQNIGQVLTGQTTTNVSNQPLSSHQTIDLQSPLVTSPPPTHPPLTQSSVIKPINNPLALQTATSPPLPRSSTGVVPQSNLTSKPVSQPMSGTTTATINPSASITSATSPLSSQMTTTTKPIGIAGSSASVVPTTSSTVLKSTNPVNLNSSGSSVGVAPTTSQPVLQTTTATKPIVATGLPAGTTTATINPPASVTSATSSITTQATVPATVPLTSASNSPTKKPQIDNIVKQPANDTSLQQNKLKPNRQDLKINNQPFSNKSQIIQKDVEKKEANDIKQPLPNNTKTQTDIKETPVMTVEDPTPEEDDLAEIREIEEKVNKASDKMPPALQAECRRLIKRVYRMARRGSYSSEFDSVSKYIDWVTRIPWGVYTEDNLDLENIKERLERHHYGLKPVKKMILEYMSVMKLLRERGRSLIAEQPEGMDRMTKQEGSSGHAPIMCFVGLQGLGKTTIGKSIGDAINRKFVRVPMGAMGDIRQLRGTAKVLPDAEPGYITKALVKAGSMNPVILLDEVDKSSGQKNLWSDIMAALLEILDPQQNSTFIDHYLEYPLDLSQVFFITTANTLGTLSAALLDRLDIIRFTSYNDEEKVVIASKYLLNKVIKASGLTKEQLIIDKDVWLKIVRPMGFDAGIRQLERTLTGLARKVAYEISTTDTESVVINDDNVKQYLPDNMGVMG